MSTIIKLCIRANILCIFGMVVSAIAVYAFNLGAWKIGGIQVFEIFVVLTYAALIISFLQDLIFKPVLSGQAARFAKQATMLAGDDGMTSGQISFVNGVIDAKDRHEKARYITGAIIGLVIYFVLGVTIGSPFAEFIALLILLLGPTILGVLMQVSLTKMSSLDPELFSTAIQMYSTAHGVSFDASLIR